MSESSNHEIERRTSFRLDMEKELIDVTWQDNSGQQFTKKVACLDFSKGGVRIDSDIAMQVDTPVTVIFKGNSPQRQELQGKVLRCIKQDTGWFEVAFIFDSKE
ncbi:PilZ domain-containing protein [Thalassotalea sp. M1531]|uniref:PilZ domain-containing protein n=1 Tax=Thalassotalea algicola TaxID=2716224 RepID=A0A7Y0LF18_9GAMM|nr:PilZ domain-containing protein [Thalassotalea algicola]NMP33098.1 PilZ domain-containing protein [Thalassotalea algicola]